MSSLPRSVPSGLASWICISSESRAPAGRSIALINNTATLKNYPIATASNLRATLAHLGSVINTDEDIVLLHIATHGDNDYRLALDLPPLELAQLPPSAPAPP